MKKLLKYFAAALIMVVSIFSQSTNAKHFRIPTLFRFQQEDRAA